MEDCATCGDLSGTGRVGGAALFFGLIAACPCHLPVTAGLVGAATGGAAFALGAGVLYASFSALFIATIIAAIVWMLRQRDRELELDEHLASRHQAPAA